MGWSVTYHKWASPKSNPDIKFDIYKCLARCNTSFESTAFTDNYPDALWSSQATKLASTQLQAQILPGKIAVMIVLNKDIKLPAEAYDGQSKKLLAYDQLPESVKRNLEYILSYREKVITFDEKLKNVIAEKLVVMQDYVAQQGVKPTSRVLADIVTESIPDAKGKGSSYYHYSFSRKLDEGVFTADEAVRLFKVNSYGGQPPSSY